VIGEVTLAEGDTKAGPGFRKTQNGAPSPT